MTPNAQGPLHGSDPDTLLEPAAAAVPGVPPAEPTTAPGTARICGACGSTDGEEFCSNCGSRLTPTLGLGIGVRVGDQQQYEIVELLGKGAFAATYRAKDHNLGCEWALKALLTDPARHDIAVAYFRQEAQVLANLHRAGIPRVVYFFEWKGIFFLVQDLVPGATLDHALQTTGALPIPDAVQVLREVLGHLRYIHERPERAVLHRDIKPSNLMRTPDGKTWLIDFGAVKRIQLTSDSLAQGVTESLSTFIYTPGYAAPEQTTGQGVTAATDLYALAITVLVLATGVRPSTSSPTWPEAWWKVLPGFDANVRTLLLQMADPDPRKRPVSAAAALEAMFAPVAAGMPAPATPTAPAPPAGPRSIRPRPVTTSGPLVGQAFLVPAAEPPGQADAAIGEALVAPERPAAQPVGGAFLVPGGPKSTSPDATPPLAIDPDASSRRKAALPNPDVFGSG